LLLLLLLLLHQALSFVARRTSEEHSCATLANCLKAQPGAAASNAHCTALLALFPPCQNLTYVNMYTASALQMLYKKSGLQP
jgi:hypothetical protein